MVYGAIQLVKFISLNEDIEDVLTSFSDAIKEIKVLSDKIQNDLDSLEGTVN